MTIGQRIRVSRHDTLEQEVYRSHFRSLYVALLGLVTAVFGLAGAETSAQEQPTVAVILANDSVSIGKTTLCSQESLEEALDDHPKDTAI